MAVTKKEKILVSLQILLFLAWALEIEAMRIMFPVNLQWISLGIAGIGMLLIIAALLQVYKTISPFPSPRKNARLVTSGAFAFARHPMYAGILFMAFGYGFWIESGYKLVVSLLLLGLLYVKSRYEEKRLLEVFPEYASYKRKTGRFFPKFTGRI